MFVPIIMINVVNDELDLQIKEIHGTEELIFEA